MLNAQIGEIHVHVVMLEKPHGHAELLPAQGPDGVPRLDPIGLQFGDTVDREKVFLQPLVIFIALLLKGGRIDLVQRDFDLLVQMQGAAKAQAVQISDLLGADAGPLGKVAQGLLHLHLQDPHGFAVDFRQTVEAHLDGYDFRIGHHRDGDVRWRGLSDRGRQCRDAPFRDGWRFRGFIRRWCRHDLCFRSLSRSGCR